MKHLLFGLVLVLAAIGRADDAPTFASPFGIGSCHVNNRSVADFERWMPQMAKAGVRVHRTCATQWGAVEPKEGQWSWDELDKQMKYLDDRGIQYGAMLVGTPGWNKLDKPGSLPVNNIAGWSKYCGEMAKHVKGRVKHFEIWNEPPNFTGKDQTPADYAKIVVAAYDAVKAVDPQAMVGLAAKSAHVNYLEQVIKAGAKDKFDYIVLHPYEILDSIANNAGSEAVYLNIVPCVRKMLAAQNPAKKDVPVIFTELGCDAKKGNDQQAHALVKAYVLGIAQGVSCIQWFEGRDGDSGPMGLLDVKGVERPAYIAMKTMIEHFGHKPEYLGWLLLNEKHYGFVFKGAKEIVLATWASGKESIIVDFEKQVRIVRPHAGWGPPGTFERLTDAPSLVFDVPEKMVKEAKANRKKPFPWGGDYTEAKEISIAFGKKTEANGLHMRSGADVAEAVVAYGGSARAGSTPGGSVFVVDPNFLSYDAVPLEITAVVRRNEKNDNAGFKFVYESTTGFKTAGTWYTVPDNKQWHTVKWTIDDPQFVNYWGYNFALESDGDKFNKYYLQSVTVRKKAK